MRDMSITIAGSIPEYSTWRKAQGYAANTLRADKGMFKHMLDTLGEHAKVCDIDQEAVLKVLNRAASVRTASSINLIQSGMSSYFRWCRSRRYMSPDQDPLIGLRFRKVPKKERKRLAIHEFPAFLDAAEDPRARFGCALGLYLFLRASEVLPLRVRDLDLQEGTIGVTVVKTGDYDVMPISAELDKEARRYLTYYQQECGPLNPNWFLVPARKQLGPTRLTLNPEHRATRPEEIVKRTLIRYGWTDVKMQGFHTLRASGARGLFDELNEQTIDGALKVVQAHLHHASVTMTERYLGLTADRVKRDRLLRGEAMFPSLDATNVVSLGARREAK